MKEPLNFGDWVEDKANITFTLQELYDEYQQYLKTFK